MKLTLLVKIPGLHEGGADDDHRGRGRLLKPAEVCKLLAVSRTWVYAAAAEGRIPAVRLGGPDGPLRFVRADIEKWLLDARAEWTPGRSQTGLAD